MAVCGGGGVVKNKFIKVTGITNGLNAIAIHIIKAPYKNEAVWKYDEEETDEKY